MPAIHNTQGTLLAHTETLQKMNDAARVLTDQQPKATQKLIQDLLSAAQTATPTVATRAVHAAIH
jgi:formate dehydrogenase assembly factor FdhD